MSPKQSKTDMAPILKRGKKQGYLTVAELADLLPAETSVEQTIELIENLQGSDIPVLERKPGRPKQMGPRLPRAAHVKLLTRGEEIALAKGIQKGKQKRIRAALRSPIAVDKLIRAARQVARDNHPVWALLADFESSNPDEDEQKAKEMLAIVEKDLVKHRQEISKLQGQIRRSHRIRPGLQTSGPSHKRRISNLRRAMTTRLLKLNFQDRFIEGLIAPILRQARGLRTGLDALSKLERQLGLPRAALGGSEALADKDLRGQLKTLTLPKNQIEQTKRQVKNAKRTIRNNCRQAKMSAEDLLAAGGEIHSGTRDANRAKQTLVEANQRLVMSIARRYPHHSLDFLDLVQEGNLGLMRAAERFDPDLGYRFGTYAAWWVRQSIGRLLAEQGSAVRIPPHVQESLQKINRITRRIAHKTGEQPNVEELAGYMDKSPERIKEILSAGRRPVSTETRVGDASDSATLLDFLPDPKAGPDEEADRRVQQAILQDAMDALTDREREIVMLRFHEGLTLQDVGTQFGITRERTRQLQEQALRKLRKRLKADLLRKLIHDQEEQRSKSSKGKSRRKNN